MNNNAPSTVTRILAGARSLFLKRNYAEVTMDQIATAADVTKGALYHHFHGKEELYLAMMHADLDATRKLHRQGVETAGSCRERLRVLTEAFLRAPSEQQGVIRLVRRDINIFGGTPRQELVRAYQAALPELVTQIVAEGMAAGELAEGDARLLAWQYVALVEVVLSDHAGQVLGDVTAKSDHVLNLFLAGAQTSHGTEASA